MTQPRLGLNATLSYPKDGQTHGFRLRVNKVEHDINFVFEESQARINRALYPHRLSVARFSIGVQLKGSSERKALTDWLAAYSAFALNPDTDVLPEMLVQVPSRNFVRRGVPLSGYEYGERVGSMLWEPTILFETTGEPWDPNRPAGSTVQDPNNVIGRREAQFFYPSGQQLSGSQAPPDGTYAPIIDANSVTVNDFIASNGIGQ